MATVPDMEEWMADANDAINISLWSPSKPGLQNVATFHPKFTYSIFGDDEKIFGYKDLKINLRYRANDMRPHLSVSYGKKMKPFGDSEPTDIKGILEEGGHLPKVAFVKGDDFDASSQHLGDNWAPPGTLHSTIQGPDGEYEIWRGSLADPAVRQLNTRVQMLASFYIEGGSYIGQIHDSEPPEFDFSDADRWTLFFLYRKRKSTDDPASSSYTFVGYATVYRFFYFKLPTTPPASPKGEWELPNGDLDLADLPCRSRLSQFLILPPFQGKGNGAQLYNAIFEHYHKHEQTHEFTVENPNEAFDDLRDACDLAFLRTLPEFNALQLDTSVTIPKSGAIPRLIVGGENLEAIRHKAKIASRQFSRTLEMHLMSQLPESVRPSMALDVEVPASTKQDRRKERLWQLVVKQRLYRHNKDLLSQIELDERIDKIHEALGSVELEYARLLAAYDRAAKHAQTPAEPVSNGKRKLDEDGDEEAEGAASWSKRARVEDA